MAAIAAIAAETDLWTVRVCAVQPQLASNGFCPWLATIGLAGVASVPRKGEASFAVVVEEARVLGFNVTVQPLGR